MDAVIQVLFELTFALVCGQTSQFSEVRPCEYQITHLMKQVAVVEPAKHQVMQVENLQPECQWVCFDIRPQRLEGMVAD